MFFTAQADLGSKYVDCKPSDDFLDDDPPCSLNTVLYLLSIMQYITCCLVFSISKPFRKPVYTNPLYLVSVIFMGLYGIYSIVHYDSWTGDTFQLLDVPQEYRYKILVVSLLNSSCSYIFEKFVISWIS